MLTIESEGVVYVGSPAPDDRTIVLYEQHATVQIQKKGSRFDGSMGMLLLSTQRSDGLFQGWVNIDDRKFWIPVADLRIVEFSQDAVDTRKRLFRELKNKIEERRSKKEKEIKNAQWRKQKAAEARASNKQP